MYEIWRKNRILRTMKGLPSRVLEEINYRGIVTSITYCSSVWGLCSLATFDALEQLHIKAAELIHKFDGLQIVKWKPLSFVFKRRLAFVIPGENKASLIHSKNPAFIHFLKFSCMYVCMHACILA